MQREVAGTMGLAGMLLQDSTYMKTARNIGDWLFFRSMISLGDRADPENPAYGLFDGTTRQNMQDQAQWMASLLTMAMITPDLC